MLLSNNAFQCVDFAILELLPRILDFFNDAVFKKCLDDLTDNVLNRILIGLKFFAYSFIYGVCYSEIGAFNAELLLCLIFDRILCFLSCCFFVALRVVERCE